MVGTSFIASGGGALVLSGYVLNVMPCKCLNKFLKYERYTTS